MNFFVLFTVILTSVWAVDVDLGGNDVERIQEEKFKIEFEKFIKTYNKSYSDKEKHERSKIFRENLQKIEQLNKLEQGTATYGVTVFADLTSQEFRKFTGLRPDLRTNGSDKYERKFEIEMTEIPKEFDWRDRGVVTQVKNQGMCGSCWAFSASGNIEGQNAIKTKRLVSLSEQELVDCDTYDDGCGGGLPTNAYKTIIQRGGLESESEYPYRARNGRCHFNRTLSKVEIDSYVVLPQNETLLAQWLYRHGPISIGINANAMQFYFGGISHPWKAFCSPDELNHGVLIVGYGVGKTRFRHKTLPYWSIKNSWGLHWGEKGYYRVYRGDGTCGLNKMATSASINH